MSRETRVLGKSQGKGASLGYPLRHARGWRREKRTNMRVKGSDKREAEGKRKDTKV